jgi:hypothetical protein
MEEYLMKMIVNDNINSDKNNISTPV